VVKVIWHKTASPPHMHGSVAPMCIPYIESQNDRSSLRHLAKFRAIGQTDVSYDFFFSIWRPSVILVLLCGWLGHPRRAFDGLYHCAKFGGYRCSSFDNMQVLVFCEFGLKLPTDAPFGGFLVHFPQMMSLIVLTPKRPFFGGTTSLEP